jgi:hypothetical protein
MTQISILSGVTADAGVDLRSSFPANLIPVPTETGVSAGYLRTAEGITQFNQANSSVSGRGRGSIVWNGVLYWVVGESLVSVDQNGLITVLGDVGDDGRDVSLTYSFDRLAVASASNLFYFKDGTVTRVTDPDLGQVLDVEWMDGYFVTTDGTSIVVTQLSDPYQVDPLKYGSSEADPDPVVALIKLRQELMAFNRFTIEVFNDVGGTNFPFSRNIGAMIEKGSVGTHTCCIFDQVVAFMGSGRNEPCSVYLGAGGSATKIATREVEDVIALYSEDQLSRSAISYRLNRRHQNLCVHLPGHTLIYDAAATAVLGVPVWYTLHSSIDRTKPLQGTHYVYAYGKWLIDDRQQPRLGELHQDIFTQYGEDVGWQFDTVLLYNESRGAIMHNVELIGMPGRAAVTTDPSIFFSWTKDGVTWSDPRLIKIGKEGERNRRIAYRPKVRFESFMGLRFRGANSAIVSFMRLEAVLEPLYV